MTKETFKEFFLLIFYFTVILPPALIIILKLIHFWGEVLL